MGRKLTLVLLCVFFSASVAYGVSGNDIARRARDADKFVSYRGIKTACASVNGKMATSVIKITHLKPNMTRTEYLPHGAFAGTVIVQNGPDIWKHIPRERLWEKVHSAAQLPAYPNREGLFRNYSVQLAGSDKVAGRDVYIIKMFPRHRGDVLHKIWVDKKCFIVLKTQVETLGGFLLSRSQFTSIGINPKNISPSLFAVKGRLKSAPITARVDFRIQKPRYLPRGYKMIGIARVWVNSHPCAHLQFSNGVNTISLFERKNDDDSDAPRVPGKLTNVMTWTRKGILFTLIGDLSRVELKKVSSSIR